MLTVNIHEAKTHLSRLVERAAKGEPFVIAKAGKPLVKVTALDTPTARQVRRLGFSRSYDVGAADYYCAEAVYWLAVENSKARP